MPATVSHALSMTSPNDAAYENQPQHWNSAHLVTFSPVGSELSAAFSNSNGISFGLEGGGGITASYVPFVGGFSTMGNTAGNTAFVAGRLALVGSDNITLSGSSNGASLTISIFGGAGAAGNTGSISGGTTRATLGEVVFSNSNGVSFGVNGQTVTGSVATSLTNFRLSAGTTSNLLSAVTFANSNGVSFGLDAGTVTASVATSLTAIRVSAGTTSNLLSALTFANGNGISFGLDASTLTASHNALTSQSNQAASADGSFTFQTLSFSNANGFSFGTSAGPAITGSYTRPVVSNAIQSVGSATGSGTNTSRFAADDHVHAGVFSMGVSTGGNTSGDTRVDVGRFVLAGGANITLSQATAAGGLNTITISAAAGGGAGFSAGVSTGGNTAGATGVTGTRLVFVGSNNITLSQTTDANGGTITIRDDAATNLYYPDYPPSTAAGSVGNSSVSVFPINVFYPVNVSQVACVASINVVTVANTSSAGKAFSLSIVFYTLNGNTLSSFNSGSASFSTFYQSNSTSSVQSARIMTISLASSSKFAQGIYYAALHVSTVTNGQTSAAMSMSMLVRTVLSALLVAVPFGVGSTSSRGPITGAGILSTNATRASIDLSAISHAGSTAQNAPVWLIMRNTSVW